MCKLNRTLFINFISTRTPWTTCEPKNTKKHVHLANVIYSHKTSEHVHIRIQSCLWVQNITNRQILRGIFYSLLRSRFRIIMHCARHYKCTAAKETRKSSAFSLKVYTVWDIPLTICGGGMDIFWNDTLRLKTAKSAKKNWKEKSLQRMICTHHRACMWQHSPPEVVTFLKWGSDCRRSYR